MYGQYVQSQLVSQALPAEGLPKGKVLLLYRSTNGTNDCTYVTGHPHGYQAPKPLALEPRSVQVRRRPMQNLLRQRPKIDPLKSECSRQGIQEAKRKNANAWDARRREVSRQRAIKRAYESMDSTLVESHDAAVSLVEIYQAMFNDVGAPFRDFLYLKTRILEEGWFFVSTEMPTLEKALIKGLSHGNFVCPPSFYCEKGKAYPRFLGAFWSEIFLDTGSLKDEASPIAVQILRQILGFAFKARVPCGPEKELKAVQQFITTENDIGVALNDGFSEGLPSDPIIRFANLLVRDFFPDYNRRDLNFRHGPGVTANIPIAEKYEAPLSPIPVVSEFGSSFFFNEMDESVRIGRFPVQSHRALFHCNATAEIKLVPKDARGPRIISAEPFENQWVQQGIRGYMYEKLESHNLCGGQINFTDQTVNRTLAREASLSQKYSTLDLKEASDRVSLALVEELFRGTALLSDLVLTRSVATRLPSGQVLPLTKFAPMGSALCFPVLATTIYSICVAGLVGLGHPIAKAAKMVFVYGDDVIISTEHADFCMNLLERYLLLINRDKSFVNSRFAESCGMDCFDGNDVSITRLKQCPTNQKIQDPEVLVALVESANQLVELGYVETAELLYRKVEDQCGKLPYGFSHSAYLNRRYQRFMGTSALEATRSRLKPKIHLCEMTQTKRLVYKAPCVLSESKISASKTSYGGHFMRIWPLLGKIDIPNPGEFDERGKIVIKHVYIDEFSMSHYPGCGWLPTLSK